jgi:hypothetical protein
VAEPFPQGNPLDPEPEPGAGCRVEVVGATGLLPFGEGGETDGALAGAFSTAGARTVGEDLVAGGADLETPGAVDVFGVVSSAAWPDHAPRTRIAAAHAIRLDDFAPAAALAQRARTRKREPIFFLLFLHTMRVAFALLPSTTGWAHGPTPLVSHGIGICWHGKSATNPLSLIFPRIQSST